MPSDEAIINEQAEWATRLIDAVQQSVIATDLSGTVIFWNAHAERMFGWQSSEALGRPIVELAPAESSQDDAIAIMERLSKGESWAGEFPVRRKDGTSFTAFIVNSPILDKSGELVGIVGVSTDVSERRLLEAKVQQAAKMEAVGRLAGGVAHDFNNLLTVILGAVDLVMHEASISADQRSALQAASDAAVRAGQLASQLLAFSRPDILRPVVVNIGDALRALTPLLNRMIKPDIDIILDIADSDLCTELDTSHFDQIVTNLAANARDAMPFGGALRLSAEAVQYPDQASPPDPNGQYVRVRVADTGAGIDADLVPQIFEQFFSTKAPSLGNGVGLATVARVVEQAGGVIQVDSVVDVGTTFSICLPRCASPLGSGTTTAVPASSTGSGRVILVVDDEDVLRTLTVRSLLSAGFEVLWAASATHALSVLADHPEPIDLLMTDVIMPGGSGLDLADDVTKSRPGTAVLLTTGYADEEVLRRQAANGWYLTLKPYRIATLVTQIHSILAAPRQS